MFGWFRKRSVPTAMGPEPPDDRTLRSAVEAMFALVGADPSADDEAIERHLVGLGLTELQATRLIQFVPIAATRYLYRDAGVKFAPEYVAVGPDRRPIARRPVADEPAYRAAWASCEGMGTDPSASGLVAVAARSGGYQALQELVRNGSDLANIITSPPILFD